MFFLVSGRFVWRACVVGCRAKTCLGFPNLSESRPETDLTNLCRFGQKLPKTADEAKLRALPASPAEFNDLQVTDFLLIHLKAEHCSNGVEPLLPGRAGIHVQEVGL